MMWLIEKLRGAWEALIVAAAVALGLIAFLTWQVAPKRRKPDPIPYPTDGKSAADVAAEILDAEYKRDTERIRADLDSDNPHERIAARWRGRY